MGVAVLATMAVVCVGGCENWNSIYRETQLDSGTTLVTDAKQRAIINLRDYRHGRGPNHRIVCSEPSPDVAQAVSVALQAGASVSRGDTKVDANLALAMASQVAQLGERLAAIQLLRDKMYRACEAYANGATSQGGYISMLARIDKTMTTMLSVEMAAGAFGRNLASLSSNASVGPGAAPEQVAAARQKLADATKELDDSTKAYNDVKDGKDDDARTKAATALTGAAAKTSSAANALVSLEKGMALSAAGSSAQPGAISRPGTSDPAAIAAIHKTYIDDDGIEGIVDACVTELASARYAYDDFLILAQKYHIYPTVDQRQTDEGDTKRVTMRMTNEQYERHFNAYMNKRLAFANYCTTFVLGSDETAPGARSFLAQRQAAKERLRLMAENNALAQQCFPVLAAADRTREPVRSQYAFCLTALQRATPGSR
jgi:hypothetical protein